MDKVDEDVIAFVKKLTPSYFTSERYYLGHLPRFVEGRNMIRKHVNLNATSKVLDCGSLVPYYSLSLYNDFKCTVVCTSLEAIDWKVDDRLYHYRSNICTDEYGVEEWDLVIMTEVLEHLPCNLYKVRDKIVKSIKPNGYILFSFPTGKPTPIKPKPYDYDYPELSKDRCYEHLREFTIDDALAFVNIPQLKVVESKLVYTREYGGNIFLVLCKKVA